MKQLSGLDATFLYLETEQMPMHVGALHIFELPPRYKGSFASNLRRHMAERLPLAPALRRKLWWMPLNLANPAWVDAEPELKWHVEELKLKKGAGLAELQAEVSRLHPQLLERKKPLWKFYVFEGLAPSANGNKRVGLYSKLHHAAVDGQAAVALANAILDVSATPPKRDIVPSKRPRTFRLEMAEMLRGVIGGQAQRVAKIIRELPDTVGTLGSVAGKVVSESELLSGKKGVSNVTLAPRTVFNASVTASRAFACASLPLGEVKQLGRAHSATINDVVLWLCSSALRRYLAKRRQLPRKSLIAAVPVSLREKGDTSSDNQASMSLMSLGTHVADPLKRLHHVLQATAAMKSTIGELKSILPTDFPSLGVPWIMEALASLYGRAKVAERIPQVANLVISNVPGPPVPLYMAGARMLTNYPASIVVHGLALNVTVQSYDQSLDFGLMADGEAMPDVAELAQALHIALDDLRALPRPGDAEHVEASTADTLRELAGKAGQRLSKGIGKRLGEAMSGAVTGAVGTAVKGAVEGAVKGAVKGAVGSAVSGAVKSIVSRGKKASR